MLRITDQYGFHVESLRDPTEKTVVALTLLRRARDLLRDVYTPQANTVRRGLDALIRESQRA